MPAVVISEASRRVTGRGFAICEWIWLGQIRRSGVKCAAHVDVSSLSSGRGRHGANSLAQVTFGFGPRTCLQCPRNQRHRGLVVGTLLGVFDEELTDICETPTGATRRADARLRRLLQADKIVPLAQAHRRRSGGSGTVDKGDVRERRWNSGKVILCGHLCALCG